MCEAALAFASKRAVELGKTKTVLTSGDTTGAQGHLALVCATAPTPHTVSGGNGHRHT